MAYDDVPFAGYCEYDDKQLPQQTYWLLTIRLTKATGTEHPLTFKPSEHKVDQNNI